ncbi:MULTISPECIES: hypothetical protein [Auritidibacter]|uniref:hypothetical protein n=1 Tax=Auritidibacter TaxID=1160973 RepID=UPI0016B77F8D|nr:MULTISPECIES: hypothetical protein [Auritidibacter]NIH70571.1 archaellum component FlaC [Auritidibacter ignavus]WGH82199.1 hypothetical protein QDX25_03270 [Auritidibacter ignavus]WGH91377.1 hypothetical protein QDX23_03140 [Auritidibacter ignavus]
MADSSFGLKIGLEGEREFKRAITDINREMRVLGSEMKLVASQFGKNATSADALTARNQVLAKDIETQKAKIETLKAALENSAESFGENDSRTKNWQIQLNNAGAELNELEKELKANNDALGEFGDETDGAGDDAKDAAKDAGHLEDAVDDLGDEMDDTGDKTRVFGDVLKANLAAEAIIAGVKGIGKAIASIGRGNAAGYGVSTLQEPRAGGRSPGAGDSKTGSTSTTRPMRTSSTIPSQPRPGGWPKAVDTTACADQTRNS